MTKSVEDLDVVGIHEAKTHLSRLVERVEGGEEIAIARRGEIVARLVPVPPTRRPVLGLDVGRVVVHDDFDAPLPDDVLAAMERE